MDMGAKNINEEIFDTLIKYKDWFSCLINAVSEPTLNQTDLVQRFSDLKDNVLKQSGASTTQLPSSSTKACDTKHSSIPDGMSISEFQDRVNLVNDELAVAMKDTFVRRINARSFLRYTKMYESGIFTKEDYSYFDLAGKEEPSNLNGYIFDTLIKYKGWFNCLIGAVGHPSLNQEDLVGKFTELKDEVLETLISRSKATSSSVIQTQAKKKAIKTSEPNETLTEKYGN
ncbi:uncharacterized protein LOC131938701 [Physella acuta]|uniref:uncharacterized protein LOC131938701 n=1 Tax=Physella acuta TaxID=109671 RepID=UPI0027DAE0B4|nr:uncharacterized protein LOC131938701 [Physella acuta]